MGRGGERMGWFIFDSYCRLAVAAILWGGEEVVGAFLVVAGRDAGGNPPPALPLMNCCVRVIVDDYFGCVAYGDGVGCSVHVEVVEFAASALVTAVEHSDGAVGLHLGAEEGLACCIFDEDACGDVVLALALEDVEGGLLVVVGLDCAEIPPPIGVDECLLHIR